MSNNKGRQKHINQRKPCRPTFKCSMECAVDGKNADKKINKQWMKARKHKLHVHTSITPVLRFVVINNETTTNNLASHWAKGEMHCLSKWNRKL